MYRRGREDDEDEVLELAEYLGIDTLREKDLLYLAREALGAPLPREWEVRRLRGGEVLYLNRETGEELDQNPVYLYYYEQIEKERAKKAKEKVREARTQPAPQIKGKTDPKAMAPPLVQSREDPLLKLGQERKKKQEEETQRLKLDQHRAKLDKKTEEKRKELQQLYQAKEEELRARVQKQNAEKEERAEEERKARLARARGKFQNELQKYEKQLRAELERSLALRLAAQTKALEDRAEQEMKELRAEHEQNLSRRKLALQTEWQARQQGLHSELARLQRDVAQQQQHDREEAQRYRELLVSRALQRRQGELKEAMRKIDQETKRELEQLQKAHRSSLRALASTKAGGRQELFDQEGFKQNCEENYKRKVKALEEQLRRREELETLRLEQRLRLFEAEEEERWRGRLDQLRREYQRREEVFRNNCSEEAELKRAQLQQQRLSELVALQKQLDCEFREEVGRAQAGDSKQRLAEQQHKLLEEEVQSLQREKSRLQAEAQSKSSDNQQRRRKLGEMSELGLSSRAINLVTAICDARRLGG